jgi:hypothetical protein
MSRILKARPGTDEATIDECLKVRLMNVRQSVHRCSHRDFNALWRNACSIETRIFAGHLRSGYGKLTESSSHPAGCPGHPSLHVKIDNLANDLTFTG